MSTERRSLIAFCAMLVFVAFEASSSECSKAQAIAAETEAGTLKSWAAVHESFRAYAHCDDGAIGEGYSESITQLLANRWDTLGALAEIVADDPGFESFVERHVDATVPKERLAKIAANARYRCPKTYSRLCERILKVANDR